MKKKFSFLKSTPAHLVFTIMGVVSCILFKSFSIWWVFTDNTMGIRHFSEMLLILMVVNSLFMGVLSYLKLHKPYSKKAAKSSSTSIL